MDYSLENKIITIVGNAGDTAGEIAEELLKKNAKLVILLDKNQTWGTDMVTQLKSKFGDNKAAFAVCDIQSDLQFVPFATYEKYGHFDAIILNLGIIEETDRRVAMDFNIYWPIEYALKYWRYVRKEKEGQNGGTIVFITSQCACKENKFLPNYQAASYSLVGFTKSLGCPYNSERTGIRVMTLCRDFTEQELKSNPKVMFPEPNESYQQDFDSFLANQTPLEAGNVGRSVSQLYEKGDSGTTWLISGGKLKKQIFKVTEDFK